MFLDILVSVLHSYMEANPMNIWKDHVAVNRD